MKYSLLFIVYGTNITHLGGICKCPLNLHIEFETYLVYDVRVNAIAYYIRMPSGDNQVLKSVEDGESYESRIVSADGKDRPGR